MRFARVGGLSSVKYKIGGPRPDGRGNWSTDGFHTPPEKHGIYAFIWPHIEPFLVCWSEENRREWDLEGLRKFDYEGPLWAHIGQGALKKGSWILTSTEELREALRRETHRSIRALHQMEHRDWGGAFTPRTRAFSQGISFSKDHLEVFIPKRHLGRIR